jgi:hypothetical protein
MMAFPIITVRIFPSRTATKIICQPILTGGISGWRKVGLESRAILELLGILGLPETLE